MRDNSADPPAAVAALLVRVPLAPLGPGRPDQAVRAELAALDDAAFGRGGDRAMASACRAGLWLAFGFLDESHAISQDLPTPEGSYWHALMHRREPDAANSGYWFRRVGAHPVFEALGEGARALGLPVPSDGWDPFDFIERCERHRGAGTGQELLLQKVQRREWELLFDWCYRGAVGAG